MIRGFESLLQFSLHEGFESLNGDSNRWLSAFLLSSHGIRISWLRIRIDQPQFACWNLDSNCLRQSELSGMWIWIAMGGIRIAFVSLHFLECGFESLCEGFESPSSVCTFWNVNSNRYIRDSNRLIRICLKSSKIEELIEGFKSDHLKTVLSVHLWRFS